jgi:hypothetical protein
MESPASITVSASWLFRSKAVSMWSTDFEETAEYVMLSSSKGVFQLLKDGKICDVEEVFNSRPGTALYKGSVYKIKSGYFFVGVAEGEGIETPVLLIVE